MNSIPSVTDADALLRMNMTSITVANISKDALPIGSRGTQSSQSSQSPEILQPVFQRADALSVKGVSMILRKEKRCKKQNVSKGDNDRHKYGRVLHIHRFE